ncbi:uncharacterized protein LOC115628823 isoform X1 [Scaptodrosophila lebanonensis]|uniref:Uncharacterized protein LOC115628823 isoform X1 n=2 Tax=Drosophila lebanonensis TaxID=7225 RepID=A0A6J2TXR3_DROLE|nr:uncharacterized protein LOC115628823 isoform X1 [Scaptodrosophila lebanonensis]
MRIGEITYGHNKYITISVSGADELQLYLHNEHKKLTYSEKLLPAQFSQRLQQLNRRVKFPEAAVRATLTTKDPESNTLKDLEAGKLALQLKYRLEGTTAPLHWEWHLVPIESAILYRDMFTYKVSTISALHEHVINMRQLLEKKDVEIKQYKVEGAQLRRSTVATKPFDTKGFDAQNEQLLADAAAYQQMSQLLNEQRTVSPDVHGTGTPDAKVKVEPVEEKPKYISPRNRKRQRLEIGENHLTRKIQQRQRAPEVQYIDSQSQELGLDDDVTDSTVDKKLEGLDGAAQQAELDACFVENKPPSLEGPPLNLKFSDDEDESNRDESNKQ